MGRDVEPSASRRGGRTRAFSELIGRTLSRLRRIATRSARAAWHVVRGSLRIIPHRSPGAVQQPLLPTAEPCLVQGWAWLGRDDLAAVHVTVDGEVVAHATLLPPRPDVIAARPVTRGASRCSWEAVVDLEEFADRRIRLGALAIPTRGLPEELTAVHAVVRPAQAGLVEVPRPGAIVAAGRCWVAGWALPPGGTPARIRVRVDGVVAGFARPIASARPDIAHRRREPAAPLAGFEHVVVLDHEPGANARIEVDVEDLSGEIRLLEPVDVVVGTAPSAATDRRPSRTVAPRALPQLRSHRGIRLVVFTHRLDLGGGQLYLQELLRHLVAEGEMSCLVISAADGPLRSELSDLGVRVEVGDFPIDAESYERRRAELMKLVADHDANIAVVNTMGAGIGADVARRLDIPTVWIIRESYRPDDFWPAAYGEGRVDPSVRHDIEDALRATEAVVFEADATRLAYAALCSDRSITIPHGVPLDAIDRHRASVTRAELRASFGLADDDVVVLSIGTVEPRKAQGALALAFGELAPDVPEARLVIVGDTGDSYARGVREVIERLGPEARIRVDKVAPDPHDWYAAADAFVLASDVESLPRVLLEAMAYELPVAATAVWGIPSLVEDDVTGILFEPRDVRQLADAMRRLLALSPDERATMAKRGAARVRERHDPAIAQYALHALIHGLAVNPTASPESLLPS